MGCEHAPFLSDHWPHDINTDRCRFLWVHLQSENLSYCETPGDLRHALENLPPTIEDTYLRCLAREKRGKLVCNPRLLAWASAVQEPLTVSHLCEMLAIDSGTGDYQPIARPTASSVIQSCVSLMAVEPIEQTVFPVHHSVRRFLLSGFMRATTERVGLDLPSAPWSEHESILEVAALSLLHIKSRTGLQVRKVQKLSAPPIYGLVHRSIRAVLPFGTRTSPAILKLPVRSSSSAKESSEFLYYAIRTWPLHTRRLDRGSPLWHAFEGIALRMEKTWDLHPWSSNVNPRTMNSHLRAMLGWAVSNNHLPLLSLVLDRSKALPEHILDHALPGNELLPALHVAAAAGFAEIMELLLREGCCAETRCLTMSRTPLHYAALHGRLSAVALLLKRRPGPIAWETGSPVDVPDAFGNTAVSLAVEAGSAELVRTFLEMGAQSIDVPNHSRQRPLFVAASRGHVGVVELLLESRSERGVNPDSQNTQYRQTPLWIAADHGHSRIVELLLATGEVDQELRDADAVTPLEAAAGKGHVEVVKQLLIASNATPKSYVRHHSNPLCAAASGGHTTVVQLLLSIDTTDYEPDGSPTQFYGAAFRRAAANGHLSIMKLLFRTRLPDASVANVEIGERALSFAVNGGHSDSVRFLLDECKVSAEPKESKGRSHLSWAASRGFPAIVGLLLDTGSVEADSKDEDFQRTPLQWAVTGGHGEVVNLLLKKRKVDVNWRSKDGLTALLMAAETSNAEVTRLLLATGKADVNCTNRHGRTPLYIASEAGRESLVELLLSAEHIQVNRPDEDGRTPLFAAAHVGREGVVKLLLDAPGIDPLRRNKHGDTPMSIATRYQRHAIAHMLRSHTA